MFGFRGKPQVEFLNQANGEAATGREFLFVLGSKRSGHKERAIFDFDNEGADPQSQFMLSNSSETYDGIENKLTPAVIPYETSQNILSGYTMLGTWQTTTSLRGWKFTSTAALSPTTRKYKLLISNPEFVDVIGLQYRNNNSGNAAASNTGVGTLVVNANGFYNARGLIIYETRLTGLTIKATPRLNNVWIIENPTLATITGKLPASVISLMFGDCLVTSIATFISEAVNVISFFTGRFTGAVAAVNNLSTLTGTLDVSHMTQLKEFSLYQNTGLTALVLPSGKSDWRFVYISVQSASSSASIPTARFDEMLASPTLQVFAIHQNGKTWSRTFVDADFSSVLLYFYTYLNSFTGNITLTTAKPTIREFKTGNNTQRTGQQQNSHPTINITGLTGATSIDLSGCNIDNLELPVNTVCTSLILYDNKLDIATNPNLVTQINAMTALVILFIGANATIGQNSTNGLGANPTLSGLVNCTQMVLDTCKLTGTLTVANVTKLTLFRAQNNPGLTAITNLTTHVGCFEIRINGTAVNLNFAPFVLMNAMDCSSNTAQSLVDLSTRTQTASFTFLNIYNDSVLTEIRFPTTEATFKLGAGVVLNMFLNPLLTTISNLQFCNWVSYGAANNSFSAYSSALNITFPIGTNNFIPRTSIINDNAMSTSNVDATIDSLYTNRAKWSVYSAAKSLNIAGSNSTPSGTYQAPAGFVLGSNDGTPASQKEKAYVLVNNYAWTITMT